MSHTKVVDGVVVDIPEGVEYVEPEVRELARGIAAEIRKHGHWQGGTRPSAAMVCVVIAPSFQAQQRRESELSTRRLFPNITGKLARLACGTHSMAALFDWNDNTPTADVLARLDAIAEGLVSS